MVLLCISSAFPSLMQCHLHEADIFFLFVIYSNVSEVPTVSYHKQQ